MDYCCQIIPWTIIRVNWRQFRLKSQSHFLRKYSPTTANRNFAKLKPLKTLRSKISWYLSKIINMRTSSWSWKIDYSNRVEAAPAPPTPPAPLNKDSSLGAKMFGSCFGFRFIPWSDPPSSVFIVCAASFFQLRGRKRGRTFIAVKHSHYYTTESVLCFATRSGLHNSLNILWNWKECK